MKRLTGLNYIFLALVAFSGLMLNAVIGYGVEPILYGKQMIEWSDIQVMVHWIIISTIWGLTGFLIVGFAKRKYDFDIIKDGRKLKFWQWILIFVLISESLLISYAEWNGFKIFLEFKTLGWFKFIFQYIYYFFEMLLVTLILIFGQKACEKWFKRANIPYGGIVIAITWGVVHFITKDFIAGILYIITAVRIKK